MKIASSKIYSIVFVMFLATVVTIHTLSHNDFFESQEELKRFYEASFDNCLITKTYDKQYKGGKGTYFMFATNCSRGYFPVLLSKGSPLAQYDLFKVNSILNKEANSTNATLQVDGEVSEVEIRHPEDEDSRGDILSFFPIIFFGIVSVIILFIPNQTFK